MKKFFSTVIAILLILSSVFSFSSCGEKKDKDLVYISEEEASKGLEFTLNEDQKSYTLTGLGECTDNDLVIPSEYSSLPVTAIGEGAFLKRSDDFFLTSIAIPSSIKSIGAAAFRGQSELTSLIIPNGVTNIEQLVFANCGGLKSIVISNSVNFIGSEAFSSCSSLESITVEEGNKVYHSAGNCLIETQTKSLIQGCKTSIIPDDGSVTKLAARSFSGSHELKSITIPDAIESWEPEVFVNCYNLESITIPNNFDGIPNGTFSRINSLKSIHFKGTKDEWNAMSKPQNWDRFVGEYTVYCTDGNIVKESN